MKLNERFIWAVSVLDIKPTDNVLEIGCGAGILAEQIANKLTTGKITAIDKSIPMIKMASGRNKIFIETGKATFIVTDFVKSGLYNAAFDKILGFNINLFWKNSTREFELIKTYLEPKGHLYIFYQAPYEIDIRAAQPVIEKLQDNSFKVVETILKKMSPTSGVLYRDQTNDRLKN